MSVNIRVIMWIFQIHLYEMKRESSYQIIQN